MMLILAAVTFAFSAGMTFWLSRPGSWLYILDHPNERSLHSRPTPRTGGVAIVAAISLSGAAAVIQGLVAATPLGWIALGGLIVAGVSLVDDWIGLPWRYRLLAHFAAAGLVLAAGLGLEDPGLPGGPALALPAALSVPLTLGFVVWMINLYNFMDGMDGFAGGMAVFGFGTFAILGAWAGHASFALIALIIAAAAGGFLLFNFPPARLFMGDMGSTTLGFLAAALMLWAQHAGVFPLWLGVLVFSPFIVDATVTLLRRLLRGERVWQAHKEHYYQRVVQLGAGHQGTALGEYALMLGAGASALGLLTAPAPVQWAGLGAWVVVYAALMLWIDRLWRGR